MNIVKVGDIEKAICQKCKSLVDASYQLKDVPFSDGSGMVKNVMAGVCTQCDSIIVMPHQSTPAIKRELDKQRESIESRVPAHMIDILNLASANICGTTELVPNMLKYYIHALSENVISPKGIKGYLSSDLATGKASKRISIKGKHIVHDTESLKIITHIDATTDLIKGVVLKINDDILVHKRKAPLQQLKIVGFANL